MGEPLKVLIIEDSNDDYVLLLRELQAGFYSPQATRVQSADEMHHALKQKWDLILSDFSLPSFSGIEALSIFSKSGMDIPFIIISGTIGEETAVETMRAGASDYIIKNKMARLVPAVRREMAAARERAKSREIEKNLQDTEEQLRHIQKMDAIGQLAGGVAHDFNNLLSVMQIYCEKLAESKDEKVQMYVEKMLKIQAKAVSLTKQLLIFSRRKAIDAVPLSINHVIQDIQDMLRRLLRENIEFVVDLKDDLGLVSADAGHIEQLLMNLLVNARDAMSGGGRLCIRTNNIRFDQVQHLGAMSLEPGDYVSIEVEDSGCGIEKNTVARIFEPFFTTKEVGKGTGLGLSIVYGIVRQSRGGIAVVSNPGEGTTFKIYLPVTQSRVMNKISSTRSFKAPGGRETILLAEDEPELCHVFGEILAGGGYNVLRAANGAEALEVLKANRDKISLVVTDMVMPRMGGSDLYRKILSEFKNIKFLLVSGYMADDVANSDAMLDHIEVLEKPFSGSDLLKRVREILDSEPASQVSI